MVENNVIMEDKNKSLKDHMKKINNSKNISKFSYMFAFSVLLSFFLGVLTAVFNYIYIPDKKIQILLAITSLVLMFAFSYSMFLTYKYFAKIIKDVKNSQKSI